LQRLDPTTPQPKFALPTAWLKFGVQKEALSAMALLSDDRKHGVSSVDVSARMGMSPAKVGLNTRFFLESGLIKRAEFGRFKPTHATSRFARRYDFNPVDAGKELGACLRQTWYFRTVNRQLLNVGSTSSERLMELLAWAAGTTMDRHLQLRALLSWLDYSGLIELENGRYKRVMRGRGCSPPV
jgi:hypothetical protein